MVNELLWDKGFDSFRSFLTSEQCTNEYFLMHGPQHIADGRQIQKNLRVQYDTMRNDYVARCRSKDFTAALSQKQQMSLLEQRMEHIGVIVEFMETRYDEARELLPNVAVVDFRRS